MRHVLAPLVLLAACSNAANPTVDGSTPPIDGPVTADAAVDAAPMLQILVVNEVAAGETPDWFEVVNVSSAPVQLEQFAYVDVAGDFVKMRAFPAVTLAPGAYHAQDVDDTISGFKLGGDEELWVYRIADQQLSDGVDWDEGAAAAGTSYARSPDTTGAFATTATPTKGTANQP